MDTGLILLDEIEKMGGYDSLDIALRSSRRRACCTRSDNGDMEYYFLSSRSQALNGPPHQLIKSSASFKQNSTAIKDNYSHMKSQISAHFGHEYPQSLELDHCSTIRKDNSSYDQEKRHSQSQEEEEEMKRLDRHQASLSSTHLEGGADGVNTLTTGVITGTTLGSCESNGRQNQCLMGEESSVAVKDNDSHVAGQINAHLGHKEHPQSGTLDRCSTSRKNDSSYDQEVRQQQQHRCQNQESQQNTLPSMHPEDSGDGTNTLIDVVMTRTAFSGANDAGSDSNVPFNSSAPVKESGVLDQSAAVSFEDEKPMSGRQLEERSSECNRTDEYDDNVEATGRRKRRGPAELGSAHSPSDAAGGGDLRQKTVTVPTGMCIRPPPPYDVPQFLLPYILYFTWLHCWSCFYLSIVNESKYIC